VPDPALYIAVVDDDPSVRKALARLLSVADLAAATFATGEDFLDSLQGRFPDCLMLDLHMPSMSGLDVLAALGRAHVRLPIVIITGRGPSEALRRSLASGASACLVKPLDDELLLDTIHRVVGEVPKSTT